MLPILQAQWYIQSSEQSFCGHFTPHGREAHNHYCWPTTLQHGRGIGVGKSQVLNCHLSHGRSPHLLQLLQKHWPTHGQCRTGWPLAWGRCICSQYHSDYDEWQGLLRCCQRTSTYIRSSLALQVANEQVMAGWTSPWTWCGNWIVRPKCGSGVEEAQQRSP